MDRSLNSSSSDSDQSSKPKRQCPSNTNLFKASRILGFNLNKKERFIDVTLLVNEIRENLMNRSKDSSIEQSSSGGLIKQSSWSSDLDTKKLIFKMLSIYDNSLGSLVMSLNEYEIQSYFRRY